VDINGFESEFFEIEIRIEPVTPSGDSALTKVSITCDWSGINNGSDDVFCSTLKYTYILYLVETRQTLPVKLRIIKKK